MGLSMELSLNLLWLAVAVASLWLFAPGGRKSAAAGRTSWCPILSLLCALAIMFPVISVTDDLHAEQIVMEDSSRVKRLSKSSGAPGPAPNHSRWPGSFTGASLLHLPHSDVHQGVAILPDVQHPSGAPINRPRPRAPPLPA